MHWLSHWLGLDNASGAIYLFWSGIGADLGYLAIVGGLYRHRNCEIQGCPRLGRRTSAAGHLLCRKHHPDGPLTVEAAHAAHRKAAGS